uniref:Ddb1 and cul4 associated factor 11 n=1 Tax=Paramormyrops kingsleyae TaxID=1676925 RepID=A0A3B3TER3_9TELE
MGSRSSSGMSSRGSSGNPDQSETGPNQTNNQQGRGQDERQTDRQSADEEDVDLAQVLAYLLRRGQVRLVHGGGATGLQLVQSYSDSDEDSDGAWEGRLGDRYNPPACTYIVTVLSLCTKKEEVIIPLNLLEHFYTVLCLCAKTHVQPWAFLALIVDSHFLPNHVVLKETYHQKAFCGVYSEDGNMFLSACQDQNIRLYDTSRGRFDLKRTVRARDVGWSVLDVCFTPDSTCVLYSSWSDYIHVCSIGGDSETHTALDLKLVTCLSLFLRANDGCLYVFDRELNRRTLKIDAHEDDVNAVAFADTSSQLLFSGSDDALCKAWDRRTLREDRPQPVGHLAGHRDGITFIHSKGDARYLISNSKDQSIKLWDVRKFSPKEGLAASRLAVTQQNWDYRWQQVPQRALKRHKLTGDTSVMTYRGHGVLHTLIRCRFSPEFSTGQKFIYSGCSTGRIVIYDVLTGSVVSRLSDHGACVRDVSWHPYQDSIVSSSWDGGVRLWEHRQTHPLDEERLRDRVIDRKRN